MDIIKRIKTANQRRDPERLRMKYDRMRTDPFIFMRGTCHLFYDRLPKQDLFTTAPPVWCCGDLHLENFGSYKGDNRLIYFDINDFDESALAPLNWEVVRILSSILTGARTYKIAKTDARQLAQHFIALYAETLASGKARWLERETASGIVGDLLTSLGARSRKDFLNSRSQLKGKQRQIRIDGSKALAVTAAQQAQVRSFMRQFAATQHNPEFYQVIDVARRIAGTGSLGLPRYIVLVEGKGSPDQNYLLDLKATQTASIAHHLPDLQPHWQHQAQRVVSIQSRMQAVPMAFLHAVTLNKHSYVLKALQPTENRIPLASHSHDIDRLREAISAMAQTVAWAQLRSAGRQGSANADALIDYARRQKWRARLLEAAIEMSATVRSDWKTYCAAYDDHVFQPANLSE